MTVLRYSPESRIAIADDPVFPSEEEAASLVCEGPEPLVILDWQTYFVKFYGEDDVPPFFPKPGEYYNQRKFPGKLFEIGFHNAVGRTRIGPVPVCVESRKINAVVYEAMLDYIAGKFTNLVFSISTSVGQHYRKEKAGRDIAYIEYLFLKKYLLDGAPNLDGIAALVLANPHNKLYREYRRNTIDAISGVPPAMLVNMFSAPDCFAVLNPGHPLLSTACGRAIFARTGKRLYPSEAIEDRKHHTVDTNENRFVKHFLQSVQHRMSGLSKSLRGAGGGYLNPDIETHLFEMERKMGLFLSDPLWNDVGVMHFIPASSQVLQRREGYRQLFRLYSLLQLATHCYFDENDFRNLLETKDTPTLFEYWAFFVVKDILDRMTKVLFCRTIVPDDPLEQRVTEGICIQYEGGISLWFNKTCAGFSGFLPSEVPDENTTICESYSHNLRPDIIVSKGDEILIFDAKFKGKGGGFYGESEDGTITSWKDEDIDKMHTYREAIRNVTGAYILYPGEKAIVYPAHDATDPYAGVGALPLKPEPGAQPVQQHLEALRRIILNFLTMP
ncbi:MAG: DUF2357 domain-containing protein [Thermodesulfobacteriota bacterium]